ncbi:MAG: hypothetical protein AB7L84_12160 [Acidimicrobiia bacterium]
MTDNVTPRWKQAYDSLERSVGSRVDQIVGSEDLLTLAALVKRTQAEVRKRSERLSRRALHLVNLPSGSDVSRLLNQIGSLEREVRDLRKALVDQASPPRFKVKGVDDGGGAARPGGRARKAAT